MMKRHDKPFDMYVLVTQSIFTIIVLIGIGFGVGYLIDSDSVWPGLLAVILGLCGVIGFIIMLIRMNGDSNG